MQKFRLIENIEESGAMQMAIDEAIAALNSQNKSPNTLRFYTWNPPCITIGYFQSLEKEVDTNKAKELNIDVVRRYTGGGAVLHDKELTYSIIISEDLVPSDIIESYKLICSAVIEGLTLLNLSPEFKPINDIIVNQKKISGNAQTRKNNTLLQHGTILMGLDVDKMFSLLKVPDEKIKYKLIENVKQRVTCLEKETNKEITIQELQNALTKGFEKTFNIIFERSQLTEEEKQLANKLYKEKYAAKEWTNQR